MPARTPLREFELYKPHVLSVPAVVIGDLDSVLPRLPTDHRMAKLIIV